MDKLERDVAMYRAIEATDGMSVFLSRGKLVDILLKARPFIEKPWVKEVDRLQDEIAKRLDKE